jgi:hypothetical protein
MDPAGRTAALAILQAWLPREVRETYRTLMRADPDGWWRHPHFAGGIAVRHILRGNGIDERLLKVRNLAEVWRELLREVVVDGAPAGDDRGPRRGRGPGVLRIAPRASRRTLDELSGCLLYS